MPFTPHSTSLLFLPPRCESWVMGSGHISHGQALPQFRLPSICLYLSHSSQLRLPGDFFSKPCLSGGQEPFPHSHPPTPPQAFESFRNLACHCLCSVDGSEAPCRVSDSGRQGSCGVVVRELNSHRCPIH